MWICGIPSTEEIRSFMTSVVGEASAVAGRVGGMASTVEVEIAGTLVGLGTDVDSMVGATGAVQAVRRMKETMMNFFIEGIICRCERTSRSNLPLDRGIELISVNHLMRRLLTCMLCYAKYVRRTLRGTNRQGRCATGASALECRRERFDCARRALAPLPYGHDVSARHPPRNDINYGVDPTKFNAYSASS